MIEDEFTQMLTKYPDILADKSRFLALLKDCFPSLPMQVNLINSAYKLGIADGLASAAQADNVFAFRFAKRLTDEYGIDTHNAEWAVALWCVCYGQRVLRKPCEVKLPAAAPALSRDYQTETAKQYDGLFRYIKTSGGYSLAGFAGRGKAAVVMPDTHGGLPVLGIAASAFQRSKLREVVISDGIAAVEDNAFKGCSELGRLVLPSDIKKIGDGAFAGTALTSLEIPPSVTELGDGAFSGCKELRRVTVPSSISLLPNFVFKNCTALEQVFLPNSYLHIGDHAFSGCSSLKAISIPDSVFVGEDSFDNVHPNFTILCRLGSLASCYASKHGIKFQPVYWY